MLLGSVNDAFNRMLCNRHEFTPHGKNIFTHGVNSFIYRARDKFGQIPEQKRSLETT